MSATNQLFCSPFFNAEPGLSKPLIHFICCSLMDSAQGTQGLRNRKEWCPLLCDSCSNERHSNNPLHYGSSTSFWDSCWFQFLVFPTPAKRLIALRSTVSTNQSISPSGVWVPTQRDHSSEDLSFNKSNLFLWLLNPRVDPHFLWLLLWYFSGIFPNNSYTYLTVFKKLYWSRVDLQCWVSFCHTARWISYTYTYMHSFLDSTPR